MELNYPVQVNLLELGFIWVLFINFFSIFTCNLRNIINVCMTLSVWGNAVCAVIHMPALKMKSLNMLIYSVLGCFSDQKWQIQTMNDYTTCSTKEPDTWKNIIKTWKKMLIQTKKCYTDFLPKKNKNAEIASRIFSVI